jgi:hypothetical protein
VYAKPLAEQKARLDTTAALPAGASPGPHFP